MKSFAPYLDLATRAARAAGDLLRADFHRPLGPRGEKDKAPADTEAEQVIRGILLEGGGDWGFLGEETGRVRGAPGAPVWVVDPNDGTRDYVRGRRGSSVSIALIWDRRPVLGVVHAFGYPDDRGAVYAAVQGREGVWKDGAPCMAKLPESLSDTDVVLVSGGGDRAARANLHCTKPARVMSIPSIAHRLARVAAGEAAATTSLYSPRSWDFAAGHCLLLAAGGALVDQNGEDPSYDDEGSATTPRLFAGSRAVALELSGRNWDLAFRSEREAAIPIVRLARGGAVSDAALLSRAQGALIGHLAGSSLGSAHRPGVNRLPAAGQIGSAGEIAIACARSILDPEAVDQTRPTAYAAWAGSSPLEPDRAMNAAAAGLSPSDSLSSAALSRLTPLALWGHPADGALLVKRVRADTALTHRAGTASDAAAVLAITLQSLLNGKDASEAQETAHAFARRSGCASAVIDAVAGSRDLARAERPSVDAPDVTATIRVILWSLANAASFENAVTLAIARSPASDALPALVGGFMGALRGREGIPDQLRTLVLSCRPMDGLVASARPAVYWATDAMTIAEALLTAR